MDLLGLCAQLTLLALATAANAPGWELLVTSVPTSTTRTCFDRPGLPNWLNGSYVVAGPAKFELGQYKMNAIFDGFGMINKFELRDRQICYTSVWMDTMYWNQSEKKGCVDGFLFEDTSPKRPMSCYLGGAQLGGDNNWVNSIQVGSEVMLLSDTALMMRLDLDTLAQPGRKKWSDDKRGTSGNPSWALPMPGHMVATGSAHPVRRPGTNTWVGILSQMAVLSKTNRIDLFTYEADTDAPQPRLKFGSSGNLKKSAYMHSYGVTPNYTVMPITLTFGHNNEANLTHCKGALDILCTIKGGWQGIHLVDNQGNTRVFDTQPFMHVHVVNSFENSSGVILDIGAYEHPPFSRTGALDISMFLNSTARDANPSRAVVRRLHLHTQGPLSGQVTWTDLEKTPNSHVDFFRINDKLSGLPYCIYYATEWWHDSASYASMAILKHDICRGTRSYWAKEGVYVGEPYFVPGPSGDEDDGLVVFVALDGNARRSMFVMLEAKTMSEVVEPTMLPGHIPFTAHGSFYRN